MKKVFVGIVFILICIGAHGQTVSSGSGSLQISESIYTPDMRVAYKDHSDSRGSFRIRYEYDEGYFMRPSTFPLGEPHYFAKIQVYRKDGTDLKMIGDTMEGYYVELGCFEDDPREHVSEAIIVELNRIK